MLISVYLLSFLVKSSEIIIKDEDIIELIFLEGKTCYILKSDIAYQSFDFIYSKIHRWNTNQTVVFNNIDRDLFYLVNEVYKKDGYVLLNDKLMDDFISIINLLGVKENFNENGFEFFENHVGISVPYKIDLANSVINHRNIGSVEYFRLLDNKLSRFFDIKSLGFKNTILLKIFKKCLRSLKNDASIVFENNLLRIYLISNINEKKTDNFIIKSSNDKKILSGNLVLKKLILWFVKALNLTKLLFYENSKCIEFILVDLNRTDNLNIIDTRLKEIIKIIKSVYNPTILQVNDVMKKEDDLSIFNDLNLLIELEIKNSNLTLLKLNNLTLKNLKEIKLKKVIISIHEFVSCDTFKNLNRLCCEYCNFVNFNHINLYIKNDLKIKIFHIHNCVIDNLFFDWYKKITDIKSLSFYNNQLNTILDFENIDKFDNSFQSRECYIPKEKLDLLLKKDTLCYINLFCVKHTFYLNNLE